MTTEEEVIELCKIELEAFRRLLAESCGTGEDWDDEDDT